MARTFPADVSYEERSLGFIELADRGLVTMEALDQGVGGQDWVLKAYLDYQQQRMITDIRGKMVGREVLLEREVVSRGPANWWEHLKQTIYPRRMKGRVRYAEKGGYTATVRVAEVWPHFPPTPPEYGPRLLFLDKPLGD